MSNQFAALETAKALVARWDRACNDPRKHLPTMVAEYGRAFDRMEAARAKAIKADPLAYARRYPTHAFAIRHLLPAEIAARISAAETDEDVITALV